MRPSYASQTCEISNLCTNLYQKNKLTHCDQYSKFQSNWHQAIACGLFYFSLSVVFLRGKIFSCVIVNYVKPLVLL